MERNERPQRMLARMAELFDLPADIVAGLCHVAEFDAAQHDRQRGAHLR